MQDPVRSVVHFLIRCQLNLHERVFVRTGVPSHTEVEDFFEREDTIKHLIYLVSYVCSSGLRYLGAILEFTEDPHIISKVHDIKDEYDYIVETMQLSERELLSLDKQLFHFQEEQNNRVNMIFAIIGTLFLPLTFITGVFGMNFDNKGLLVEELYR